MYDEMLHPTSWVTTQGIDFLRRRDTTKPFFLMMSYHRPHPPLDPPGHYINRYEAKELPPIQVGDWVDFELPIGGHDSPVPRDQAQIDYARRAYYAQITCIDHHLNRLIMGLFEADVLRNTAILFVADHGEMLYTHNQVAKGTPYDGSARIPFLLRLPQTEAFAHYPKNHNIGDAVVEIRDILPTCCDIAGVDVPEIVDGASILPLCRGEASGWREHLHGEHVLQERSTQWLTDGREKYIWFTQTGRELLFDLENDPEEMHDLSQTKPEHVAHWRAILKKELAGREEAFVQNGDLVVGRPQSPTLVDAGRYGAR